MDGEVSGSLVVSMDGGRRRFGFLHGFHYSVRILYYSLFRLGPRPIKKSHFK